MKSIKREIVRSYNLQPVAYNVALTESQMDALYRTLQHSDYNDNPTEVILMLQEILDDIGS